MIIQKTIEILQKFQARYVAKYDSEREDYDKIESQYDDMYEHDYVVDIHYPEGDYWLHLYIDEGTDELHIEDDYHTDVTEYAEENGWSKEDVEFIKFGKQQKG